MPSRRGHCSFEGSRNCLATAYRALSASAATSLPPLNLLLAYFAISDQRIHTCLCQPLPCAVHAKAEGLGLNPILATMPLVIVGAGLPYRLAIGMLGRSHPSGKGEYKNGNKQGAAHLVTIRADLSRTNKRPKSEIVRSILFAFVTEAGVACGAETS